MLLLQQQYYRPLYDVVQCGGGRTNFVFTHVAVRQIWQRGDRPALPFGRTSQKRFYHNNNNAYESVARAGARQSSSMRARTLRRPTSWRTCQVCMCVCLSACAVVCACVRESCFCSGVVIED